MSLRHFFALKGVRVGGLVAGVLALAVPAVIGWTGSQQLAHAATTTTYQSTVFSDETWGADRTIPSGGFSTDGNSLTLSVDNANASPSAGFYRTEGVKADTPLGVNAVSATLNVDPTWGSKPVRAGLWLTATDSSGDMAWPTIEYAQNIAGYTGVRVFDTMGVNGWMNVPGYVSASTLAFEISVNPENGHYDFFVNGTLVKSYDAEGYTIVKDMIFNSYNSATTVADNYTVNWTALKLGVRTQQVVAHNVTQNRDYYDLQTAVDEAAVGDTVGLTSDITIEKQVTISRALTLDGASHRINAAFSKTDNSNNSALAILGDNVTVKNAVIDGTNGINLHGINVWHASNVNLDSVTVQNNKNTGLNVGEGANVTVNNLTTSSNGWHGVDVDKAGSHLIVNGVSHHNETKPDIFIDNITIGNVVDTNHQYGLVDVVNGSVTSRIMKLKLAAPTNLTPVNSSTVYRHDFDNTWSTVAGAVKYEYTTTYGPSNSQTYSDTSDSSNYDLTNPTTVVRHNNGSPVSTYNWKVRAIDAYGIAGEWASSTVTYSLPSVNTAFTACDSFRLTFTGYNGLSSRITWYDGVDGGGTVLGYTTKTLSADSTTWASGSGKLGVKSVKYVITNSANSVVGQGVVNNPSPCQYKTAGWAADGKSFSIGKMNLPTSYSVVILWPDNATTKSMGDMNISGWWSGGGRLNVPYFSYVIKNDQGIVIYRSPQFNNPMYVAPDATAPQAPTVLEWHDSTGVVTTSTGDQNGTAVWNASASSDVAYYIYHYWNDIAGNPYKQMTPYSTTVSGLSLPGVFNQGQGVHHYCVIAVDTAGNQSACSQPATITYGIVETTLSGDGGQVQGTTDSRGGSNGSTNTTASGSGSGGSTQSLQPASSYRSTYSSYVAAADASEAETSDTSAIEAQAESRSVLGATSYAGDGDVLAATDEATANGCQTILGVCWYYWIIPIVVAIIGAIWWLAASRRRQKDDEIRRERIATL